MWLRASKSEDGYAEFRGILDEVESGPDRSAAIVAAACVEDELSQTLQSKLLYDEVVIREMFRTSGPLGSFSAKINMGYLLNLYDKDARKELSTVKEIRNLFAHRAHAKDFQAQRVQDLANNLTMIERLDVYFAKPPKPVSTGDIHVGDRVLIGVGLREAGKDQECGLSILPELAPGEVLSARKKYTRTCQFFIGLFFMITHKDGPSDVSQSLQTF